MVECNLLTSSPCDTKWPYLFLMICKTGRNQRNKSALIVKSDTIVFFFYIDLYTQNQKSDIATNTVF